MAQKTEKEETDQLKVPETLTLRSPSISTVKSNPTSVSDDVSSSSPDTTVDFTSISAISEMVHLKTESSSDGLLNRPVQVRNRRFEAVNRCSGCRKKVGLTGFRCRCGEMFCSDHRYSDRHDCSYDYKAAGREAIARENPVVRAAKILKV